MIPALMSQYDAVPPLHHDIIARGAGDNALLSQALFTLASLLFVFHALLTQPYHLDFAHQPRSPEQLRHVLRDRENQQLSFLHLQTHSTASTNEHLLSSPTRPAIQEIL